MHPLLRRFTDWKEYQIARRDVMALDDVLNQIYWGRDRTPKEAHEAIDSGTVLITGKTSHGMICQSNGLLLTKNGYVVSTLHGIQDAKDVHIIAQEEKYSVRRVCSRNKELDIALVKASMSGDARALPYRFEEPWTVDPGTPVRILANKEGVQKRYGFFTAERAAIKPGAPSSPELFTINLESEKGFSGGVCTLKDGSILGLLLGQGGSESRIIRIGAKIGAGLHLVAMYRAHLAKKYGL
jgi:hypothetical protein